jgi:hypothetical protein
MQKSILSKGELLGVAEWHGRVRCVAKTISNGREHSLADVLHKGQPIL